MARTPAQRGTFGRWLTDVRTARYERQVDALEAMKRLAGLHISQAEYSQWESGSRVPRDDNPKVARLYEFFGSRPTEALGAAETGDQAAAAIREQTEVFRLLLEEQRMTRMAQETIAEAVGELVGRFDRFLGVRADRPAEHEPATGAGSR